MYPMRIQSKIPNPKIVRPQTVPSKLKTENFVPNYINNAATNLLPVSLVNQNDDDDMAFDAKPPPAVARCKSALPVRPQNAQRPRTGRSLKTSFNSSSFIEPLDFNNILSTNELNLKTYKEIDKIAEVISGYQIEPERVTKEKLKEKDEIYKKFWLLKSTGKYHGSLLGVSKTNAPEIRE